MQLEKKEGCLVQSEIRPRPEKWPNLAEGKKGRRQRGRGATWRTGSENGCPCALLQHMVNVSSSQQHFLPAWQPLRANSEGEGKCSLSRSLSEPSPNGLILPSSLPAGCTHHLSESHLAPEPLSCPNGQEFHRSLQLAAGTVEVKG